MERADKIIVINNGVVMEQGNHVELMEARGMYYKLVHRYKENTFVLVFMYLTNILYIHLDKYLKTTDSFTRRELTMEIRVERNGKDQEKLTVERLSQEWNFFLCLGHILCTIII